MTDGVVLLNFGEPAEPDREAVIDYLQLIFLSNADLEDAADPEARARELAERRAPGLLAEYEAIDGSPLNEQATDQAERLQVLLEERDYDVQTFVGMQYTEPFIEQAVSAARDVGVDRLLALPVYPLCGPSTTVLSLDILQEAVTDEAWDVPVQELTGWHTLPGYQELRADAIRAYADEEGLDLSDTDTAVLFSAHGTPKHYLEAGSRYDEYVRDWCRSMKDYLLLDDYFLAFQNHENRDIPWTEPEVEETVEMLADSAFERVVVDPISFLHEQSETLSELDIELRETAEAGGLDFYRVPIPHDDERVEWAFADLLDPFLSDIDIEDETFFQQCECRPEPGTMCLNAPHGE